MDNTQKRFEAAIDRLNKLAIRIDSRIAKLDELGVNTVNAKSALVAARAQITLAQTKLDAAAVVSVEVAEGETPQEAFNRLKTVFDEAKKAINEAHGALVKVVASLKAVAPKEPVTATSTATVE